MANFPSKSNQTAIKTPKMSAILPRDAFNLNPTDQTINVPTLVGSIAAFFVAFSILIGWLLCYYGRSCGSTYFPCRCRRPLASQRDPQNTLTTPSIPLKLLLCYMQANTSDYARNPAARHARTSVALILANDGEPGLSAPGLAVVAAKGVEREVDSGAV
ncbi:hypothetical protein K469DRAFT_99006 [Zopfia rhizophila CBS 207.26]|uniref:Uncharacterized protein n=1 Tax=Zopfia rhizophila CBS 207.26 TaxID=1314779 RepID=A0A6A6EAW6_9PEZI|nr:hypothetical protein K469DRAFT_99006 [Zopfia rhizophila CBS 207.26]